MKAFLISALAPVLVATLLLIAASGNQPKTNDITLHGNNDTLVKKKIIHTENAPQPIGPYSQAVEAGNLLFISGQIAIDPANGNLVMNDIQSETRQVMKNIHALLTAAGLDFNDVVKATIFLSDIKHFGAVNEVYGSYFSKEFPARETVQAAALPKYVNVEISMIAAK